MPKMDLHDNAKKVVLCSALFAGFAYFSLSILRNNFSTSKKSKRDEEDKIKASQSCQTEVSLPVKSSDKRSWYKLPPGMWGPWAKSIQDRIKDLNLQGTNSYAVLKHGKLQPITGSSLSSNNTPRHSPRSQSPISVTAKGNLSRSVDNLAKDLNIISSPAPDSTMFSSIGDGSTLDGSTPLIKPPTRGEMLMYQKILDQLYGKKNPNISQQEASVLGMLLMSEDGEVLVKALSVIADCAVFTRNIDVICDSGCLIMLLQVLTTNQSAAVVAAATQAIGNLATGERAQELMKPFIAPLLRQLRSASQLQTTWSLIALANLAHRDSNHLEFLDNLIDLINLLETGSSQVQLQVLKILVNLSCNPDSVVYLLASQSPSNLHSLLDMSVDEDILIRLCSFLANLVETVFQKAIRPEDLPPVNKAASPETIYAAIFALQSVDIMKEKLTQLSRHSSDNVRSHVNRILKRLNQL